MRVKNEIEYWRLLDGAHKNMIFRHDHGYDSDVNTVKEELFKNGKWEEAWISPHYLLDFGDYYGQYEEITEAEAMELTGGVA